MSARSITAAFAVAAMLAAVPCTFAQADKKMDKPMAMAGPKPAAEMSNLKFFDGSWTCSGEGAMEPGGAMMKMESSVMSHTDMGGFWQSGTVKAKAMGGMPPFEGMFHMTYDPASKGYLMLWIDNVGGRSEGRSTGWTGDKIVFTGDGYMGADKVASRDTFAKNADGSMVHTGEAQVGGKWVKMMEETCRKGR
jgi:hypothetical protein